jgi:hypothetical protein
MGSICITFPLVSTRMWMRLRHWWYAKGKPEAMPREVREYAIRRYLAIVSKGNMSPQEKDEAATRLYVGSVNLAPDQVSIELRGEMAAASVNLVGQIPGDNCILCKRPLFKHESVRVDAGYICNSCQNFTPFS